MPVIPRTTGIQQILASLRKIDSRLAQLVEKMETGSFSAAMRISERREFTRLLDKLDEESRKWVLEVLPEKYARASRTASKEAGRVIGAAAVVTAFTAIDLVSIARIQSEVQAHFDHVRRDITVAVDNIISRGGTIDRRVSRVQDLFDTVTGSTVVNVNGKTWRSDKYARAVVVSRVAEIAREATKNAYLNNGISLVRINRTGSTHNKCVKWEGAVLSITGSPVTINGTTYPTLESTKEPGGVMNHPFCRHRFTAISL